MLAAGIDAQRRKGYGGGLIDDAQGLQRPMVDLQHGGVITLGPSQGQPQLVHLALRVVV
ncbi:hypothetical protein D3C76_1687810 [compost metagenome]